MKKYTVEDLMVDKPPKKEKKNRLRLNPQEVNENLWYYEDNKGLTFVHAVLRDGGEHFRTDQILVPWKMILASVDRYSGSRKLK